MAEGGARRPSSSFVLPVLLVAGDAPEIDPRRTPGVVRRVPVSEVPEAGPVAAMVFDLRCASVADFAVVRGAPWLADVPLLLLSGEDIPEVAVALLSADDALVVPKARPEELARRVALIVELGRLRLISSFAEQALEQSVTGLSIADTSAPDTPIVYVTPVFEALTGYSGDEVLGKNCRFLQGSDRDQHGIAVLRAAVAERRRATAVLRNYGKDGTPFWNEVTVFPLLAYGLPTSYLAGVQHDVTALAQAHAEISSLYRRLEDEQRFDHAVLDGVDVGIVTADDRGVVTFVNRCAAQLLDLGLEDGGLDVQRVLGLARRPGEILGDDARRSFEHRLRTQRGDELELDLTVSRGEGGSVGYFFIFRDVREEKAREAERSRFERLAAMGTMVAGFAHEVRNPVAAMRSIAEELAEELRDMGVATPHVGLLLQMVERVERLVRTSLQFGRPAVPKRAPQRPWIIAAGALAQLRSRLREPDGDIAVEAEPDLPDVFVDERQLVQVLVILLNNALDATGAASRVILRIRSGRRQDRESRGRGSEPPSPAVRFDVIDDGPGISPAHIGQIFDPFFTTKASGTGLGLSIAQQIVNENSCRIEVSSTPGVATVFSVFVPATVPSAP